MRIKSSEITPKDLYLNRREWLQGAGLLAVLPNVTPNSMVLDEKLTPKQSITTYNNFYEFGTDKSDPAANAGTLKTKPWTVEINGQAIDYDSLIKPHALQERVYRMRCVEGWSMVIPWIGIPLADVLKRFEAPAAAKYVAFETLYDQQQMSGQKTNALQWPYVEGLRLDEAMHPLTILAVGLYGEELLPQNGAPLRLVVPWKYGYKSIKSIVKISYTEQMPPTSWNRYAPDEYGFYSNVNPDVSHPRWSQATERRIGEFFKRDTLMFNGYADEVAVLYAGMDLKVNH